MSLVLVPEELSMIVSSNPANGASNVSNNGSQFEIAFNGDGIAIPKEALNINVSVQESTIWWTTPNIEAGKNNKLYLRGEQSATTISSINLGFDANVRYNINNDFLTLKATIGIDPAMPHGVFLVGDSFIVDSGSLVGNQYLIQTIISEGDFDKVYQITPNSSNQAESINGFSRYREGLIQNFIISLNSGLYDLAGLNNAVSRELELQGARDNPAPLISFSPDEATQRVQMRVNYTNVVVDFTFADTPRSILGFDSAIYGSYALAPVEILAPAVAGFNTINYFLIQSDLVQRGIRINGVYNQTVSQVLIDVAPGSQIVSTPFNPPQISAQELAGAKRSNIRFRLTDDKGQPVNTNGEYWSARVVIKYLMPVRL